MGIIYKSKRLNCNVAQEENSCAKWGKLCLQFNGTKIY